MPVHAAERDEARDTVRAALRRAPAAQREALVLAYWGGMTADEIARRSDVPLGTAKSRIRLGLARLREECGEGLCQQPDSRRIPPGPAILERSFGRRAAAQEAWRAGEPMPAPGGEPAGANRRLLPP